MKVSVDDELSKYQASSTYLLVLRALTCLINDKKIMTSRNHNLRERFSLKEN